MEDLLGWSLVLASIVGVVWFIYATIKFTVNQRNERIREEHEREVRYKKDKEEWKQRMAGATHVGKTTYDYNADKTRTTVTNRTNGQQMSYVHTNDSGPDLLTTMIVADMLFNHKESSSGTVKWDNDVPSVTTSDNESRKSSSWSSDSWSSSSDSSPSYSDSGPSFSDSGPSSDW